jgi:catechol 2,3-dioxygenase-like lactoylglutathione lyase family enzyme
MTRTKMHMTHVRTVIVPVSDQDRALEFYEGKLGFEKRADIPYGEERWIDVAPPGAETTISIVPPSEGESAGVDTNISFATTDAAAAHAELHASGVEVDEEVMRPGGGAPPMFFFRDPDGNRFLVVERD